MEHQIHKRIRPECGLWEQILGRLHAKWLIQLTGCLSVCPCPSSSFVPILSRYPFLCVAGMLVPPVLCSGIPICSPSVFLSCTAPGLLWMTPCALDARLNKRIVFGVKTNRYKNNHTREAKRSQGCNRRRQCQPAELSDPCCSSSFWRTQWPSVSRGEVGCIEVKTIRSCKASSEGLRGGQGEDASSPAGFFQKAFKVILEVRQHSLRILTVPQGLRLNVHGSATADVAETNSSDTSAVSDSPAVHEDEESGDSTQAAPQEQEATTKSKEQEQAETAAKAARDERLQAIRKLIRQQLQDGGGDLNKKPEAAPKEKELQPSKPQPPAKHEEDQEEDDGDSENNLPMQVMPEDDVQSRETSFRFSRLLCAGLSSR
eukprot:767631-Hanusia_phi.AAC.2